MILSYVIKRRCISLKHSSLFSTTARPMATVRASLSHEERTESEPRENTLEPVVVANVREVNESIRLFRLNAVDPNHTIRFLPGQWLDTFIPGLSKAGGFTITSTPSEARPTAEAVPSLELAVQKSTNPPAQWLWQTPEKILGTQLLVRVGGSFTWPPPLLNASKIDRLVLIAGGVGIKPREIHFIYSTKAASDLDRYRILFLPRLMDLIAIASDHNVTLSVFLTGTNQSGLIEHGQLPNRTFARRLQRGDLLKALNGSPEQSLEYVQDRSGTVCYVCGPPTMTDELVSFLRRQPGMPEAHVLCEKWW